MYSLFIPLKDTTKAMGATQICLGTYVCNYDIGPGCDAKLGLSLVDNLVHKWPIGYGALINQQTFHHGTEHFDGPDRILFILTFASQPRFDK